MRTHLVRILLVAALLALPVSALAQDYTVDAGSQQTIEFTHDGLFMDGGSYFVLHDGAIVMTIAATGQPVTIQRTITAGASGNHTIVARAQNSDGLLADSDPMTYRSAKPRPNKPGKPRIVAQTTSLRGTMQDLARATVSVAPEPAPLQPIVLTFGE
jgi:hypothetical protein